MSTTPPPGERIAKVIARSGRASRRDAEALIRGGRVTVNGTPIDSPALNVTARDRITIDGTPLAAPEPPRVWLYHKPTGLVTTARDEQGRETIFDKLPEEMPRVMSVGRLDLNSEGLLLLTNDGEIKRKLELPATGWLRKYRVRVKGTPTEDMLIPLREGVVVDREAFQPMMVTIDRQQGANAWLTIGLREGKNREIRRAMEAIGLTVNRLIRVSYGPFQLGNLKAGAVQEVRPRALRDQLGIDPHSPAGTSGDTPGNTPGEASRAPRAKPAPRRSQSLPRADQPGAAKVTRSPRPAGGPKAGAKSDRAKPDRANPDRANPQGAKRHGAKQDGAKPHGAKSHGAKTFTAQRSRPTDSAGKPTPKPSRPKAAPGAGKPAGRPVQGKSGRPSAKSPGTRRR